MNSRMDGWMIEWEVDGWMHRYFHKSQVSPNILIDNHQMSETQKALKIFLGRKCHNLKAESVLSGGKFLRRLVLETESQLALRHGSEEVGERVRRSQKKSLTKKGRKSEHQSSLSVKENQASQGGFPGGAGGKEPTCPCRRLKRHRFDPWIGKISWRRRWQPTPVILPGESHRLAGRKQTQLNAWSSKYLQEFSILLCMRRCKHLSSLNPFLSYASQLSGPGILFCFVFHILSHCQEWQLAAAVSKAQFCLLGSPPGSEIHIWRVGITDGYDFLVYRYSRRHFMSQYLA